MKDTVSGVLSPPGLRFSIRSIFEESLWITHDVQRDFTAIQQIFIRLHIGDGEVKERPKVHHSYIDHIAIQSALKYLIGAYNMVL
jgi:hypothetical protein